jgi:hypothetical protein
LPHAYAQRSQGTMPETLYAYRDTKSTTHLPDNASPYHSPCIPSVPLCRGPSEASVSIARPAVPRGASQAGGCRTTRCTRPAMRRYTCGETPAAYLGWRAARRPCGDARGAPGGTSSQARLQAVQRHWRCYASLARLSAGEQTTATPRRCCWRGMDAQWLTR